MFHVGAHLITSASLESGNFTEMNPVMAQFYGSEISHILSWVPTAFATIAVILLQMWMIRISRKSICKCAPLTILLLPVVANILFFLDFFHDFLLFYFGINWLPELANLMVFNQWLMSIAGL